MMAIAKQILKIIYFPLMSIIFVGAEILVSTNNFGFHYTLLLMALALIVSFGVERIIPHKASWNDSQQDVGRDILHFLVNESMNYIGMFLLPFLSVFALFPQVWPSDWGFAFQLLLAIVLFDIGSTLFHYLSHKNALLWRFHAIHHAPTRLYGFNGVMKHPAFQLLDGFFALGPLVIIGIPQDVAISLVYCVFIQLLIQHSNADLKTGALRWIFATAEIHRFHHLKGKAGDVNFGLFFSVWDRLLGTTYFIKREPLGDSEIGIGNTHYPSRYWAQIKKPFELNQQPIDSLPKLNESLMSEAK